MLEWNPRRTDSAWVKESLLRYVFQVPAVTVSRSISQWFCLGRVGSFQIHPSELQRKSIDEACLNVFRFAVHRRCQQVKTAGQLLRKWDALIIHYNGFCNVNHPSIIRRIAVGKTEKTFKKVLYRKQANDSRKKGKVNL